MDRLTVLLAEDKVSSPVVVSPFLLFGDLALAVKSDQVDCGGVEVDDLARWFFGVDTMSL